MMDTSPPETRPFLPLDEIEGAFDWWREAGVDLDFSDDAAGWLAEPEGDETVPAPAPVPPKPPVSPTPLQRAMTAGADTPPIGGADGPLPRDLAAFREWWMTEKSLAHAGADRRLPPRGVAGARLMILVPQPFKDDGDGLLSGGAGSLVSRMLQAMGIEEHEAYLASALPAVAAMPDWGELAAHGLGRITRHHVALAKPERLLILGRALLPLFDVSTAEAKAPFELTTDNKTVPTLLAPGLAQIARSPAKRERLWARWLDWTQ